MIYIACPYTHDDEGWMRIRKRVATGIELKLIEHGLVAYNAIRVMSDIEDDLPEGFDVYAYDLRVLSACEVLLVVRIDGWKESKGVQLEIAHAQSCDMPIVHVDFGWEGDAMPPWIDDCKRVVRD